MGNMDDLQRQIEADELADKEELTQQGILRMSPIEYARKRGLQPQLVYYWIRAGHVKVADCICGRPTIDIASADAYLVERDARNAKRSGSGVPSGTD